MHNVMEFDMNTGFRQVVFCAPGLGFRALSAFLCRRLGTQRAQYAWYFQAFLGGGGQSEYTLEMLRRNDHRHPSGNHAALYSIS